MITPVFDLSQDDDFVKLLIRTPYVKFSDVEFYIDGSEFKFYVKPYFLRLNLPGELIEDGRESASYDVDKGTFTVKLPKLNRGETFEGLDLLTTLLAPKRKAAAPSKPLIEQSGDYGTGDQEKDDESNDDDDDEFDWEIEQQLPLFSQSELHEMAEIPHPETMSLADRRSSRKKAEDVKFDEEYYLADLFNVEQIQHLLDYKPPWREMFLQKREDLSAKYESDSSNETRAQFTDAEKDQLRRLPNKDYLLDKEEEIPLYLGLVDIIYAYAYNHRTTEGENTVESCWTIARISSTFSWFESFTSVKDVLISCARRTLAYPLYRHWSLVAAVLQDTKEIFALGRRQILKCLLEIHALFLEEDPWFLLNDLYITDYCVWIQKASQKKLTSLTQSIEQIEIRKSDLSWELEELEYAATLVQGEEGGAAAGQAAEARDEQSEDDFHCDSDNKDQDDGDDDDDDDDDEEDDDDDDDDVDDDKNDADDDNDDVDYYNDVDDDDDVNVDDANGGGKCVDNNKRKDDIGQSAAEEFRSEDEKEGNGLIFSNANELNTTDSL
ncbi:protein SHQ1 homolog isoform X2 [Acropora muricata]|uniref:protein SHQ1 homolog isoform X2 n=1 Tax=Acropora muricata TaxID=159855 RepID=UPI0034E49393